MHGESVEVQQFTNPDGNEKAADQQKETNEKMLMRAAYHIKQARAQRRLYRLCTANAIKSVQEQTSHSKRIYTLVVDYGQNMDMPAFNSNQPGETYYYSPLSVYNLGVVNTAHVIDNDHLNPEEHLHAHVYHKGQGLKGGNSVASLLMQTLRTENILREGERGGELNVIFDNCSGQNKNNKVLALVPFLVEMGYFKKVSFVFLVVGHTKIAADRLFNALKELYRKENIGIMTKLYKTLNASSKVTVHQTNESDFQDWGGFLNLFYRELSGLIKQNHIFSMDHSSCREGNKLLLDIKDSDLEMLRTCASM